VPSSSSRERRTTPDCGSSSRSGWPRAEAGGDRGPLGAASSRSRSQRPWRTAPPSCSCAGVVRCGARVPRSSVCPARRRFPRVTAPPRSRSPPASARSCRSWRRCSCRWRAPLPTRGYTPAFTIQATSRRAPRSGSARAFSPSACRGGSAGDELSGASRRVLDGERLELNPGPNAGCRAFACSARIGARGCERTSSPVRCWPRSSFRRAWPMPSWPGFRRSPVYTRPSPAWWATRCWALRGCSCSDQTPLSRR
jgi:hypothetical protein